MQSLAVSESPELRRGNLLRFAWVALWAAIFVSGVLMYAPAAADRAAHGAWWVVTEGINALINVLILFVAVRLSRRFPLGRTQPFRHVGPHLVAAAAVALGGFAFDHSIAPAIDHVSTPDQSPALFQLASELISYALCAAVGHGIEYVRRSRRSDAAALRLRADVAEAGRRRAEAELRALKAELNPHFLGNALHSVSSLIRTDVGAANRALAELGDLLRSAISRVGTQDVTLGEEIDGFGPFIELERARFGDGLEVRWVVDDIAREARVPLMILQVLVDSALKHGFATQRPASVLISAARAGASGDQLLVEVGCAGTNLRSEASDLKHGDATLAHLQARLRELYGPQVSLELETSPEDGAVARLRLPWRQKDIQTSAEGNSIARRPTENLAGPPLPLFLSAFFTFVFVVGTATSFDSVTRSGVRVSLGAAVAQGLDGAAIFTIMLYLAIRLMRSGKPAWRAHGVAAAVFGIVLPVNKIVVPLLLGPPYKVPPLERLLGSVIGGPIVYGFAAAIVYAVVYARRYRGSEAAALQLRTELAEVARRRAEAELRALKMELNPHFLGNSLAAVSLLSRKDPDGAQRMLAELGDLLRGAAAHIDIQEVTLSEELKGLAPFLAVERARFGDRLVVSWDVDAATLDARVPHMILQPLVENAVKHGLSPRGGPGHIVVAGRRAGEKLELSVRDDGVGLNGHGAATDWRGGVGLTNARARLERLYGAEATLDLVAGPGVGTIARLSLPWR